MRNLFFIGASLSLAAIIGTIGQSQAQNTAPVTVATQANPPAPPPNSVVATPSTSSLEQLVFRRINEYRTRKGLSALEWDGQLAKKARGHSEEMARKLVPIGHAGFEQRVKKNTKKFSDVEPVNDGVKSSAKKFSYKAAAENVAYNKGYDDPVAKALQSWLTSSGHRHNIEGQYTVTGVGVSENSRGEYYFTQIFVRK